ncbi:hypothetical protein C8R45DRAFT_926006 [Mycena sanguinolenta]|nr:hypothetical protein C8R45DRAFT_926006 [Mycena sanguinolenta]
MAGWTDNTEVPTECEADTSGFCARDRPIKDSRWGGIFRKNHWHRMNQQGFNAKKTGIERKMTRVSPFYGPKRISPRKVPEDSRRPPEGGRKSSEDAETRGRNEVRLPERNGLVVGYQAIQRLRRRNGEANSKEYHPEEGGRTVHGSFTSGRTSENRN